MINNITSNLKDLAAKRPLKTQELFSPNDWYGHAHVLKKYAQVEENYQIKAVIEHSAMLYGQVLNRDIVVPIPSIFTFSDYRFLYLRQITNKALFAIGPSIHYADTNFSEKEIALLKEQLGKTLLVFLPCIEKTHLLEESDRCVYLKEIKKYEKEFDNILVCLDWIDILNDREKPYLAEGYTCVTAGHVFDMNFLQRLKTLILLSCNTMSFEWGDHVGFCIYLDRPHWIYGKNLSREFHFTSQKGGAWADLFVLKRQYEYFESVFKEPRDEILDKQKEIVRIIWGTNHIKTPKEIKHLLDITEDIFKNKYMPCDRKNPILFCQICDYLEKEEVTKAKLLIDYAKKIHYHPDWIRFFSGIFNYLKGNRDQVEEIGKKMGRIGVFERKKRELLDILEGKRKLRDVIDSFIALYPKVPLYQFKGCRLFYKDEGLYKEEL